MTQAARRIPTQSDRNRRSIARETELYGLIRDKNRTAAQVTTPVFGQSAGSSTTGGHFLKVAGDTMIGPIAFFPSAVTISSGAIDVGDTTTAFTSRLIVAGEGAADDDLDTISNAHHAGQFLNIQTVAGQSITLTNNGNIRTSTGEDMIIAPQGNILLVFDSVANEWTNITSPNTGSPVTIYETTTNPALTFFRDDATPNDNDTIGLTSYKGKDSGGNDHTYAQLFVQSTDVTDGTEDCTVSWLVSENGLLGDTRFVINPSSFHFQIASAVQVEIDNGTFYPTTDDDIDLGKSGQQFKDLYLDGTANIDVLLLGLAASEGIGTSLLPTTDGVFDLGNAGRGFVNTHTSVLNFNVSGGTGVRINGNTGGQEYRVSTGDTYEWFINSVSEMILNATQLDMQANNIVDCGSIEPQAGDTEDLGTSSLRWNQVWCEEIIRSGIFSINTAVGIQIEPSEIVIAVQANDDITFKEGASSVLQYQGASNLWIFSFPIRNGDYMEFIEAAAPGTPDTGVVRIYAKTDGRMYQKDDTGTENAL